MPARVDRLPPARLLSRSMFAALARLAVLRGRWIVGGMAVAVLVLLVWDAGVYKDLAGGGFYAPNDQSTRAEAILDRQFPGAPPNTIAVVSTTGSVNDAAPTAAGTTLAAELRKLSGVTGVLDYWQLGREAPLRSKDGKSALVLFRLGGSERQVQDRMAQIEKDYAGGTDAARIRFGGAAAVTYEATEQGRTDLQKAELISAPLAFLVLLFIFGSAVTALLPVIVGAASVVATVALLRVIAQVTDVSVFAINMITAVGFGLAVDYSLFLLTRYREERGRGAAPEPALVRTLQTAGRTVVFSAGTVALSLVGTLIFPLYFLRSFAVAGVAVVIATGVATLVLLPCLIMILGDNLERGDVRAWIARRRRPARARHRQQTSLNGHAPSGVEPEPTGVWAGLGRRVMARPVRYGAGAVGILVVLALPLIHVNPSVPDDHVLPSTASSHIADDAVRDQFPTCYTCNLPLVMPVLDARRQSSRNQLNRYAAGLSAVSGVDHVDTATGTYRAGKQTSRSATPITAYLGRGGTGVWVSVWLTAKDPLSASARTASTDLRAVPAPSERLLGGLAPHFLDSRDTIVRYLPVALGVIIVATSLLLFLFTGSVLMPAKALALDLLGTLATLGVMVLIFQDGHLRWLVGDFQVTGAIEMTSPLLMISMAFGLSMDYEIFLLSRIREEHRKLDDDPERTATAVVRGLAKTGPLLTRAAVAVIVVMIALASSQVVIVKVLGVGLIVAVVLDITLVRGVLLPAFMQLAGKYNWWAPPPLRWIYDLVGLREAEPPQIATPGEPVPAPRGSHRVPADA